MNFTAASSVGFDCTSCCESSVIDAKEPPSRVTHLPFRQRRSLLNGLGPHGPAWQTSALFDDPEAL